MKYQLVIQFPLTGSVEDFERLIALENELGVVLRGEHKIDGHDLGEEEMNIFIHTDTPKEAFTLAKNVLTEKELKTVTVAYREFNREEYSVLWPEHSNVEFRVN